MLPRSTVDLVGMATWPSLCYPIVVVFLTVLVPVATAESVHCGSTNQVCPLSSPICCGVDAHFCIAAGYKCCDGYDDLSAAMCAQNEECCPGSLSNCCTRGTRCVKGITGNNKCVTDRCTLHTSQEDCVVDERGECGWCCAEHRCVSTAIVDPWSVYFGCSAQPLTSLSEACPSRCHQATTCGTCTSHNSDNPNDTNAEECGWCCATMTCMPASELPTSCVNEQYTLSRNMCYGCYADGGGVSLHTDSSITIYSITSSFMFLFAFGAIFIAVRMIVSIFIDHEKPTDQQVQEAVRRYGFEATDAQPSSPVVHHQHRLRATEPAAAAPTTSPSDPPGADAAAAASAGDASGDAAAPPATKDDAPLPKDGGRTGADDTAATNASREPSTAEVMVLTTPCAACKEPIRLGGLEAHLSSVTSGAAARPKPAASATHNTHVGQPPSERPKTGDESPAAESGAPTDPTTHSPPPSCDTKDDPAVIFLPCGHCCCYKCAGVPPNMQNKTAPPRTPPAPTSQTGSGAPPPSATQTAAATTDSEPPTIEQVITKKKKGKCPACRTKFTDILITDKVRNI